MVDDRGRMLLIGPLLSTNLLFRVFSVLMFMGMVYGASAQTRPTASPESEQSVSETLSGTKTPHLQIVRTETPPDIDGDLHDSVWANAAVIDTLTPG